MKRCVFLLISLFLSGVMTIAQDFYTIQIRSLSRETPLTMEELQVGMWQHKVEGQTKCFLGRYDTYEEAKKALDPLKESRYPKAFVVSSDKIFSSGNMNKEANPSTASKAEDRPEVKKDNAKPKEIKPTEKKPVEIEPAKEKPKEKTPAVSGNEIFSVQIAAYRYPLYTKDFDLEEKVMEFYCSDNIYRYAVGKFENKDDAYKLLEKIRKSGYPDAFVIDYKKYEVYRIE